jgi:hypothetical protein
VDDLNVLCVIVMFKFSRSHVKISSFFAKNHQFSEEKSLISVQFSWDSSPNFSQFGPIYRPNQLVVRFCVFHCVDHENWIPSDFC